MLVRVVVVLPGVNFFVPSSQCGVVFCICDENSVDNTDVFITI